jgi:hypothetical protein
VQAVRAWIKAVAHLLTYHAGQPILSNPTVFKTTDLNLAPFAGHGMAPNVSIDYVMLNPTEEQYRFVLNVKRGSINMNEIIKIATPGPSTKEPQSHINRETHKTVQDTVTQYQLMFTRLTSTAAPKDTNVQIISVNLPAISNVFKEILNTTKVSKVVRMTQEQFTYHLTQRSTSKTLHDASVNYNAKALNAPKVTALKRAHWADHPLSIEPDSIKDRVGIYHFAPPRTGSYQYEQCSANGCTIFQQ